MINDPYAKDAPSVADPANNLFDITPDDDNDLPVGIKALRITNEETTFEDVVVTTVAGDDVTFKVPPTSVWIEPLRAARVLATGTGTVTIQGYTDDALPA